MHGVTVGAIWSARIKGVGGFWKIQPGEFVEVDEFGIKDNRRFVVVNEHGDFVAQRQGSAKLPLLGEVQVPSRFGAGVAVRSMCLISARIEDGELVVNAPDMKELRVPAAGIAGLEEEEVKVWRDPPARVIDQGDKAAAWFTEFLSREREGEYRLMRISDESYRPSKVGEGKMNFQDGFPFLMSSDSALGQLNGRLFGKGGDVVTADRFRLDVWLRGCAAHAEDHFSRIRIGDIELEGMTLCDRCSVICTDQNTGVVHAEPSATLSTYRRGKKLLADPKYQSPKLGIRGKESSVFWGRNFNHRFLGAGPHLLRVGDEIEVLETD